MVEVGGGVDVALTGQIVHPLIHLLLRHLGHVSFVDLLATYPVVLEVRFLDASSHFDKRVCLSVGWSVDKAFFFPI